MPVATNNNISAQSANRCHQGSCRSVKRGTNTSAQHRRQRL